MTIMSRPYQGVQGRIRFVRDAKVLKRIAANTVLCILFDFFKKGYGAGFINN